MTIKKHQNPEGGLKKWGFSSPAEARAFAKRNKQDS